MIMPQTNLSSRLLKPHTNAPLLPFVPTNSEIRPTELLSYIENPTPRKNARGYMKLMRSGPRKNIGMLQVIISTQPISCYILRSIRYPTRPIIRLIPELPMYIIDGITASYQGVVSASSSGLLNPPACRTMVKQKGMRDILLLHANRDSMQVPATGYSFSWESH